MTDSNLNAPLGSMVRRAVFWRSGSQVLAQLVAWGSTLAVIRILDPSDYGIFAMTQVVLAFLSFLNGYGFASSLIQEKEIDRLRVRQAFGLLILINGAIALIQVGIAPLAAAWYRQPIVGDLLRVQALIFLATPFIALPEVLLMREMDFRRPAIVNLAATAISASVALGSALSGFGVWTLVYAPIAFFWARAMGLVIAARLFILPSFRFAGTGRMVTYGLMMLGSHFFWTITTQADVFIASRSLGAHELGLYAEALFLTTIIASKFVPPLNEVAFPAFARIKEDLPLLSSSFLKAVKVIMVATCPLYFGLAAVASDAIEVVLGGKWIEMAPLVSILALAMPALTLHILFAPAVNAVGHPEITMRASLFGAIIMPLAFLCGLQWGAEGLALSWLIAFPAVPLFSFIQARPKLGISSGQMARSLLPGIAASAGMAIVVLSISRFMWGMEGWLRLIAQIGIGGLAYGALLLAISPGTLRELLELVLRRTGSRSKFVMAP